MRTRIQKWGNCLAIRIPKAFAIQVGLEQDKPVDLSLVDGKLIVVPVVEPEITLDRLLARITEENVHYEVDTGPAVGNEAC